MSIARILTALLVTTFASTALANPGRAHRRHHRPAPPPPPPAVCDAGELRIGSVNNAWFDVYVDGVLRLEARNLRGQAVIGGLAPGDHHVRITPFVGRGSWSDGLFRVECGTVIIGEVAKHRGLSVLNQWSSAPVRPVYAGRPRPYARPVGTAPPVCTPGRLDVATWDGAWYDLYVDGRLRVESRVGDDHHSLAGLQPGRHHVRVTDFMGRVMSDQVVDIGCGQAVVAEVRRNQGLTLLASSAQW